jgi:hypothetical protein
MPSQWYQLYSYGLSDFEIALIKQLMKIGKFEISFLV